MNNLDTPPGAFLRHFFDNAHVVATGRKCRLRNAGETYQNAEKELGN